MLNLIYLISACLFIFGLKKLTSPKTARNGNIISSLGMLLAIITTLTSKSIISFEWIIAGLIIGSVIGIFLAIKIKMTAMPELVAILNSFGGIASILISGSIFWNVYSNTNIPSDLQWSISLILTIFIGIITFIGSIIAFLKLRGIVKKKIFTHKITFFVNIILFFTILISGIYFVISHDVYSLIILGTASLIISTTLVFPVGGADMPVIIALLNSFSGLAASFTGFILNNNVLIISGALVGASGLILTQIMCKAMNRSLISVLFSSSKNSTISSEENIYEGKVKQTSADELAIMLEAVSKVVIIPGYGLAVAQAQHVIKEISDTLIKNNVEIYYAIHPVAGRMPGHMNVLLAEAGIPYEQLCDLDVANRELQTADLAIIVGANDVVNPAANDDENSPIYGMPILEVENANTIITIKRSLSHGYAGIPNKLFIKKNSLMIFGDAKDVLQEISKEMKE